MQPIYRATVYAPRSVDPTETTVLTPIAGAVHADPFQIATSAGVAGFRPYLTAPQGRRGRIDPLTRKVDTGQLSLQSLDKRTATGNLERWITAFIGDQQGKSRLIGRKVFVEESIDGGATWSPFFTGRIQDVRLSSLIFFTLVARDFREDLKFEVFSGPPHSSLANAWLSQLLPNGMDRAFGAIEASAPATAVMHDAGIAGFAQLDFKDAVGATAIPTFWDRLLVTKPVYEVAQRPAPGYGLVQTAGGDSDSLPVTPHTKVHVSWAGGSGIYNLATVQHPVHRDGVWFVMRARPEDEERFWVESLGIASTTFAGSLPPTGVLLQVRVTHNTTPTKNTPLFIDDVHPAQLLKDLLDGKFGRLGTAGETLWSVPYDSASLDALIADTSIQPRRFVIDQPWDLAEFIETQICQPSNLAYRFDGSGRFVAIDMRMPKELPTSIRIENGDLDVSGGKKPSWSNDRASAITIYRVRHYVDRAVELEEVLADAERYPDVTGPLVASTEHEYIFVLGDNIRDYGDQTHEIDALGLRSTAGEQEADTQERAEHVRRQIDALIQELRGQFGAGAMAARVPCRRTANASSCHQGDWRIIDVDALPDPASNRRGGTRLMRCIERMEEGPTLWLTLLDAGPNSVALPPTLGTLSIATEDDRPAVIVPVTTNAAGDPVLVEFAATSTSVSVRPAEDSDLWTLGARQAVTGNARIIGMPDGRRIWIRGYTPAEGQVALPSAYAYPDAPGYVDTPVVPRLRYVSLTVSDVTGEVTASWLHTALTAGVRLAYATHLPGVDPGPLATVQDADADLLIALLTNLVLRAGEAITVEFTPYTGWTGTAVSGTAGTARRATITRAANSSTWGILKVVRLEETETQVHFEVTVGVAVEEVSRRDQLVRGASATRADPFTDGTLTAMYIPDANGIITFWVDKPRGDFTLYLGLLPLVEDEATGLLIDKAPGRVVDVDPVQLELGERIKMVSRTGATAVVRATLNAPAAAFPVTVSIYREDPDPPSIAGPKVLETTADYLEATLANLPLREPLEVFAIFTDVAGQEHVASTTIHRDPLPWGSVTVDDGRADSVIHVEYDDDTDALRITCADAKVLTLTGLSGGGSFNYEVGETARDDLSVEPLLKVDEFRRGYLVEIQGGTEWRTIWGAGTGEGVLHGQASNPATIKVELTLNADKSAADVTLTPEVPTSERVSIRLRKADGDPDADIYTLVSADDVTLYVASGTAVGPASLWDNGLGLPIALLNDVPLKPSQFFRWEVQAVGEESGVPGPWTSIVFTVMERPQLAGLTAAYHQTNREIMVALLGGPHMGTAAAPGSAFVEADEVGNNFASPLTAGVSLYRGQQQTVEFLVPISQAGVLWEVRGTPYNGPLVTGSPSGLAGDPVVVRAGTPVDQPLFMIDTERSADGTTETVVVYPLDPDERIISIEAYVWRADTAKPATTTVGTARPGGVVAFGPITLHEKHSWYVQVEVALTDGSVITAAVLTLDIGIIPTIEMPTVAVDGTTGTIRVNAPDTDVATVVVQRWTGTAWETPVDWSGAPDNTTRVFQVTTTLTSSTQRARAYGLNSQNGQGPALEFDIPKAEAGAGGEVTDVSVTTYSQGVCGSSDFTHEISWTAENVPTTHVFDVFRSEDGGAWQQVANDVGSTVRSVLSAFPGYIENQVFGSMAAYQVRLMDGATIVSQKTSNSVNSERTICA